MKQKILILLALAIGVVATPLLATGNASALFDGAKGQVCRGANLDNSNSNCNAEDKDKKTPSQRVNGTIQNIINLLTLIVGIAAVVLIIINGLRFVTANGDSGAINTARNGIIYALIGAVIAAFAQIIVRFVLNRI